MSTLSDLIISAVLKRGVAYEAKNVDVTVDIPQGSTEYSKDPITVRFTADNMTLKLEKENKA